MGLRLGLGLGLRLGLGLGLRLGSGLGSVHRLELQRRGRAHHLEEGDEVLDCRELVQQLHAPRVAPAVEGG